MRLRASWKAPQGVCLMTRTSPFQSEAPLLCLAPRRAPNRAFQNIDFDNVIRFLIPTKIKKKKWLYPILNNKPKEEMKIHCSLKAFIEEERNWCRQVGSFTEYWIVLQNLSKERENNHLNRLDSWVEQKVSRQLIQIKLKTPTTKR